MNFARPATHCPPASSSGLSITPRPTRARWCVGKRRGVGICFSHLIHLGPTQIALTYIALDPVLHLDTDGARRPSPGQSDGGAGGGLPDCSGIRGHAAVEREVKHRLEDLAARSVRERSSGGPCTNLDYPVEPGLVSGFPPPCGSSRRLFRVGLGADTYEHDDLTCSRH